MTSWLRQSKKDKHITPLGVIFDLFTYIHSGDKDTAKLSHLLHDTHFESDYTNTINDKFRYNGTSSFIEFFKKYYHDIRNYQDFELKSFNIIPVSNTTFNVNVLGQMVIFDDQFGFWKLIDLSDKYTIDIANKNGKSVIKKITLVSNGKFIRFVFERSK